MDRICICIYDWDTFVRHIVMDAICLFTVYLYLCLHITHGVLLGTDLRISTVQVFSEYNTSLVPGLHPSFSQAACFGFPAESGNNVWSEPVPVPIDLSCPPHTHIHIQRVLYVRPDSRGDQCTTDQACFGDTCCCGPWKEQNCSVDLQIDFPSVFSDLIEQCDNTSECRVNCSSQSLDGKCTVTGCQSMNTERIYRCWARWIQVYYRCTGKYRCTLALEQVGKALLQVKVSVYEFRYTLRPSFCPVANCY